MFVELKKHDSFVKDAFVYIDPNAVQAITGVHGGSTCTLYISGERNFWVEGAMDEVAAKLYLDVKKYSALPRAEVSITSD